ncbi:hypothetical protein N0V84_009045 [Fusarium piperis]|uniref:DUF6603 domain-containing protein n=1 Tax=Fusarium piperis TaxID=1435070 RepID=A0A9W8W750_9HYPO|nr:hypothetical protein N0V84_009045 [Fusarium piperis]
MPNSIPIEDETVVESFHINVGLGDCAIHVLATKNTTSKELTAKSAVLIDGGLSKEPALNNIVNTIKHIEGIFVNLNREGKLLKFRSVVVTHWDEDHWKGIDRLLDRESDLFDKKTHRYRRFYNPEDNDGTTTLYAPNIPTIKMKKKMDGEPNKKFQTQPGTKGHMSIGRIIDKDFFFYHGKYVANALLGNDMIGYDFFTGKKPSTLKYHKMKTLEMLMGDDPPEVGMYCIASNLSVVGLEKRPRRTKMKDDQFLIYQMPTKTNQESIATIIVWKNKHVSHYSAGDLDFWGENLLIDWLKPSFKDKKTPFNITCMKSSHHGARNSNPPRLFYEAKPKHIIFSVANHYGHPAWEVLIVLFDYYIKQKRDHVEIHGPCIFTSYPYWLIKMFSHKGLDPNGINVDVFLPEALQKSLSPTRKRNAKHLVSLFKSLEGKIDKKQNLYQHIQTSCQLDKAKDEDGIMEQIGIGMCAHAQGLFRNLWELNMEGEACNEVNYIRLTLVDNAARDGFVKPFRTNKSDKQGHVEKVFEETEESKEVINFLAEKNEKKQPASQKIAYVSVNGLDTFTEMIRSPKPNKKRKDLTKIKVPPENDVLTRKRNYGELFMMQNFRLPDSPSSMSALADTSPRQNQGHYGILSSSYNADEVTRDESAGYAIMDIEDWLDDFLLSMRPSVIRLESDLQDGWTLFHEHDFLGQWIRTGLDNSEIAFNPKGPKFRIKTRHKHMFNTSAADEALGLKGIVSVDGLSVWTQKTTMVLGLNPAECQLETTAWSISEILAMFPTDANLPDPSTQLVAIVNDSFFGLKWTLDLDGSKGRRNAIWISPASNYRTVLRLYYVPEQDSKEKLCQFLGNFFPSPSEDDEPVLDVSNVRLIFRKVCAIKLREDSRTTLASVQSLTLSAVMTLRGPKPTDPNEKRASVSPTVSIELTSTGALELTIRTTDDKDDFTTVLRGWLSKLFPESATAFGTLGEQGLSKNLWFRRLILTLAPDKSISKASVAVEVNAKLGQSEDSTTNVPILFEAKYEKVAGGKSDWSLSGQLWLKTDKDIPKALFADYEEYRSLEPVTRDPAEVLKLTTLFGSLEGADNIPELPAGIPNAITKAGFRVNQDSIFVSGTIADCRHTLEGDHVPALRFRELSLEAQWNWTQKLIQVELSFWLSLKVPEWWDSPDGCAANALIGSVSYKSGGQWTISAQVRDLNLGMLYDFFPRNVRDTLFQLLKGIRIVDLAIVYQSHGSGNGTDLMCKGNLMLGDVVSLGLVYECRADGTWIFNANLGLPSELTEPVTLGQIMDSLVDSSDTSLSASLPDFLADTVILGGPDSDPKLELTVENDGAFGPRFTVTASIAGFEVEFVQIKDTQAEEPKDNGEAPASSKGPVKILRLFKAVLTRIPMPKDIPILGHMEQPFDELGFFWVNQAVSKEQLSALDPKLKMPSPPPGSSSGAGGEKTKKDDIGMTSGFHFVIISKGKVAMDYPIGKAREEPRETEDTGVSPPDEKPLAPVSDEKDKKKQSSKGTYKNTLGPVNITQIGFRYEGGSLAILMDATFALGPMVVDLMGFTLGLHFEASDGSTKGLQGLSWNNVQVSISGLGVMFDRPPLTIAGAFLHEKTEDSDMYAGGLTVGFDPWLFQAAGFYGVIGKVDRFKCLFAYAMLRGPIMNIAGFAEISGLTGAFGYNIDLTLPTLNNVTSFPLLTPSEEARSAKDLVRTLLPSGGQRSPFFNPLDGAMFVAAGLTVTAFQMLEMTAVVAVQWSPRVQLALLGLAKCDVPSIKTELKFAHIELGVIATIDLDAKMMKLEAQLSPNSWIIHKSCHLTGGFAMYYWFGPDQTDWVMTMGGYHSAFVVPAHYPRPDRLRISWCIDSSLSVTGEAYFAITPKVCMGGLRIRAALSLGALYAWFDAAADFLMTYAPFHFIADVKVSVGVRYSMDVWFVTVNISVEIAASLSLMGPPLRGIVHVDFWVFGFDIAFGDPKGEARPEPVSFNDFWKLITQAESSSAAAGTKDAHLFSCTKGLMTEKKKDVKATDPWLVRSGLFQFTVECQFAIQSLTVNGDAAPPKLPPGVKIDDIYAKPMRREKPIASTLAVVISDHTGSKTKGWDAKPAWKRVPQALWGQYKESEDPNIARAGSDLSSLLSSGDNMACLLMGVVIEPPTPKVSLDKLSAFRVDEAMKKNIFESGKEPPFQDNEPGDALFMPGRRDPEEDHWAALKTAWGKSPEPRSAVDMWQDVFGTTGLVGEKPTNLIENNGQLFLSAPFLGSLEGQ